MNFPEFHSILDLFFHILLLLILSHHHFLSLLSHVSPPFLEPHLQPYVTVPLPKFSPFASYHIPPCFYGLHTAQPERRELTFELLSALETCRISATQLPSLPPFLPSSFSLVFSDWPMACGRWPQHGQPPLCLQHIRQSLQHHSGRHYYPGKQGAPGPPSCSSQHASSSSKFLISFPANRRWEL